MSKSAASPSCCRRTYEQVGPSLYAEGAWGRGCTKSVSVTNWHVLIKGTGYVMQHQTNNIKQYGLILYLFLKIHFILKKSFHTASPRVMSFHSGVKNKSFAI